MIGMGAVEVEVLFSSLSAIDSPTNDGSAHVPVLLVRI
jgi:hypothetical protein